MLGSSGSSRLHAGLRAGRAHARHLLHARACQQARAAPRGALCALARARMRLRNKDLATGARPRARSARGRRGAHGSAWLAVRGGARAWPGRRPATGWMPKRTLMPRARSAFTSSAMSYCAPATASPYLSRARGAAPHG